jgi:hypothetical protein
MDHRIGRRITANVLLLGLAACVSGCDIAKYSSPQATFEASKAAFKANDWKGVWDCYTPDSLTPLAGMLAAGGSLGGREKAAPVFEKHGVVMPELDAMRSALKSGKSLNQVGEDLVKNVRDKGQFIVDMNQALLDPDKDSPATVIEVDAQLRDVKIDGDSATSLVVSDDGSSMPLRFKRIGGQWKMVYFMSALSGG